jgi:hypothetical protein
MWVGTEARELAFSHGKNLKKILVNQEEYK